MKKNIVARELFKMFVVLPAFFGFIFVPTLAIASQWGQYSSPTQHILSKIIVTILCLAMYTTYPRIFSKLRSNKEKIKRDVLTRKQE